MNQSRAILPGETLGVLGGGQLGRMFAIAARRMGYRLAVFTPEQDSPTGQVADVHIRAAYDDLDAVARFAQQVSVVTFEFENIPAATAHAAGEHTPLRPRGEILHITQNRQREKSHMAAAGIPVTPFAPINAMSDLEAALKTVGLPAVIKTASWGYDGKGQRIVKSVDQAREALTTFGRQPCIAESLIDFDCELSVVAVRGLDGSFAGYGPMRNAHENHILDVSVTPAGVSDKVQREAVEIARAVVEHLDLVGVLCVELFLTRDDRLLINELAPRPHNSGHLTIDGHVTCQFEQQVRAICGLPLGSTALRGQAVAMANLLGDLWQQGEPNWTALTGHDAVKLHLYGKTDARPGRKMGHITAVAENPDQAQRLVRDARACLTNA